MADTALIQKPEPLTDPDNVGPLYVDYRTQAADDALIEQARQRAKALSASNPAGGPGSGPVSPSAAPEFWFPGGPMKGLVAPAEGPVPGMIGPQGGKDVSIVPALKDVVRGVPEIPQAVWYGLQKAASSALGGALDFAHWAGTQIEGTPWTWPLTNEQHSKLMEKLSEFSAAVKSAPDADSFLAAGRPETVTGNVIASATQFLSVASRAGAAFKAMGMAPAAANIAGSFTSATIAFQGAEDSLAEWIQSNPKYANFVTEFLASDPDDSEAEKRLKNGLEGLLGDALFGSFLRSLKFLKVGRAAGISQEGAALLPPKSELPELTPQQLQRLGDPNAPLVQVTDETAAKAGQTAAESSSADVASSIADDSGIVSKPIIAAGEARYATRGDQRFVQLATGIDELGEIPAEVSRIIKREAGPIRLPEGTQDPATGKGFGEVHIEARHGAEIRDYGYDDAATLAADVAANYRFIYQADEGGLILVKPNGGHKIAIIELKPVPGGQNAFEAHWEVETAGIYRPDFFKSKELLWQRPGPGNSSAGEASSTRANPFHPGDQSKESIDSPAIASNAKIEGADAGSAKNSSNATKVRASAYNLTAEEWKNLPSQDTRFVVTADGKRFLGAGDGSADFGTVPALRKTGDSALPIRVRRVKLKHIDDANHRYDATQFGYRDGLDLLTDVANSYDQINEASLGRLYLVKKEGGNRVVVVELQKAADSDYWDVVTVGRRHDGQLGELLWERTRTLSPLVGAATPFLIPSRNTDESGKFARGQSSDTSITSGKLNINFRRIEVADDVREALDELADMFPDDVSLTQRGVASKEATQAMADALGMSVDDVLKQRNGVDFTPEHVQAARRLLAASQEKLIEVARDAAKPGATAVDQYAFRRMLATHYGIQAEVLGAGSKTASALDTWRLPAGTGQEQMRALEQRLQASGGADVSKAMAGRLSALAQAGVDAKVLNQAIRRAASANSMDAVRQIYVDGLLSTPLPHVANTAGGIFVAMQQIVERGVAGKIARAIGSGGVAEGEATAMMYSLLSGQWDALRLASRTMIGKATQPAAGPLGKLEGPRFDLDQAGGPGRVVDYLGKALGVGPKVLDGTDAYFKSIGYRMELHAQAFRQARSEGLEATALGERVAALVADPPPNIRLAAADAALYNTFSNPNGAIGQALLKMRNGGGALNPLPFIFPLVRAPINVTRYSFERTPLAPLVGQWRADVAAGGARRDLALARMAVGSTALAVATDLAMQGKVSGAGPKEPGERDALMKAGWRPHAVNIGGQWHAYNPSDPLGQTLAFAADLTEALNSGDVDPDHVLQWDEVTAGGVAALAQFATNKAYLQGLADFAQVMTDPERYGRDYVNRLAGPLLSAGGGEPKATPLAAMAARLPALTAQLTPRRDLWGESAVDGNANGNASIDQELLRLGAYPSSIQKKTSFQNVPVNFRDWPEVYDAYVRLAGNGLKSALYDGLGAKDLLDQVVSGGNRWSEVYAKASDGPEGTKARFIQSIVRQYRTAAETEIMKDPRFKDFAAYVRRMQTAQSARAPAMIR